MLKTRIPPAVILIFCILIAYCFAQFFPLIILKAPFKPLPSLILFFAGTGIILFSGWRFFKSKTTVDPRYPEKTNTLVVEGLYRYSRNPMYVGMAMVLLGVVMYWAALSGLAALFLFIYVINTLQIIPEEYALARKFGGEYDRYCAKVRRWI